jgi:YwiC-like protein
MLPREHGAYSQMILSLVTSVAVARAAPPALLLALAVVCGFLAHEPLLVLLGGRGARPRTAMGWRAAVWLAATLCVMVAAGAAAFRSIPAGVGWSFLMPLVPAAWVAASVFMRQEKSASCEVAVALAFALAAIPICLAASVRVETATAIALVFASVYVTGVLCVRAIVVGKRRGGNPGVLRTTRFALLAVAVGVVLAIAIAVARQWVPGATLLAAAPGIGVAVALARRCPPPPLKTVGWSLAMTSAAAALILIAAL